MNEYEAKRSPQLVVLRRTGKGGGGGCGEKGVWLWDVIGGGATKGSACLVEGYMVWIK